jgi:preprotein translocase subunit YajC
MMLAQTAGGGSSILILMVGFAALLYFMMRSQRKRTQAQQDIQRSAEIGDEIMTTAGIFGTIVDEDEEEGTILLEIAPGTRIRMLRAGISRRVTAGEYDDEVADDDFVTDEDPDGSENSTGDDTNP